MGVKVAAACLHWSQSPVPHPPSSPQTRVSTVSSPSLKRRSFSDGALVFRYIQKLDPSTLFGSTLYRSKSDNHPKPRAKTITRAYSDGFSDAFSDEEFSKQLQELAMKFQLSDDEDDEEESSSSSDNTNSTTTESEAAAFDSVTVTDELNSKISFLPFEQLQPPEWSAREEIIPACIERKANSVDIPFSLRIIKKKKKQLQQRLIEAAAGDSAYSSVKKAFSSMVFIIRELHSFTLQMREMLFYEDLQGILTRVQSEMHASFVWLFQQVFSHTPQLMISVMILLANYSVYSMSNANALAEPPPPPQSYMTDSVSYENHIDKHAKFDSSPIKTFSVNGKTASISGNNGGGGGKFRRTASGTEGDGRFDETTSLNSGATLTGDTVEAREEESVSGQAAREEELRVWNAIVEEAARMQGEVRDEALDHETVQRFVSPVTAKIEGDDDYADYFRTELVYQMGLAQDPENCVLLANYAQFLFLVARDFDRAEEYFKRAVKVEPPDAEALSKYAGFLWLARKDLWAAEETYLEAISAEPTNSYYAANYAHFLWNTGGEDTCFPIDNNDDA